jgi:hypothetical protein
VLAKNSVLGQHTLNLQLKPTPVGEVLKLLSGRSKAVAKLPEGLRPADEGRPWEVDGADKLGGIVVAVNFVETPVEQLVAQLLGCVGFGYVESGDRIAIEKSAQTIPAEQCTSVSRVSPPPSASATSASYSARMHSFDFEAIPALDFIERFSNEATKGIVVPSGQTEYLKNITLRVKVVDMPEDDVLRNMFGCIGWTFDNTRMAYVAFKSDARVQRECRGFSVL